MGPAQGYHPLGFPRGEAGRLDGSSEPARLTEEGWRLPRCCLHFVQWYQPKIIADSFTTWRRAFIKPGRNPTHRTLHEAFGARHPSSVTPRWGAPAIGSRYDCHRQPLLLKDSLRSATPPGGSQGGLCVFARGFIKRWVPTATPLRLAKSRLAAVARLHGACASLSQPLRAASSALHETAVRRPLVGYTC